MSRSWSRASGARRPPPPAPPPGSGRPSSELRGCTSRADDVSSTVGLQRRHRHVVLLRLVQYLEHQATGHPGQAAGQQRWGHQPVAQHDEHVGARAPRPGSPVLAMMASLAPTLRASASITTFSA